MDRAGEMQTVADCVKSVMNDSIAKEGEHMNTHDNQHSLQRRCTDYLQEHQVPVTKFCRRISLSRTAYYQWQHGTLTLSTATEGRIENLLNRYNF